jgi:hypothetical protein
METAFLLFLQNSGIYLQVYTAQARRPSTSSPPREPQISLNGVVHTSAFPS